MGDRSDATSKTGSLGRRHTVFSIMTINYINTGVNEPDSMQKKTMYNRRSVLKTTGITLGTLGTACQAAAGRRSRRGGGGNSTEDGQCRHCPEVIEESEDHKVVIVTRQDEAYLFRVNKQEGTVVLLDSAPSAREPDTQNGVSAQDVTDPIIEDIDFNTYVTGDCNGYIYNTHRAAVLGVNTGQNVEGLPETALSSAVCAVLTGKYTKSFRAAVLGAVVCGMSWQFLFGHVNLVGTDFSIGAWDAHVGWLGEEAVQFGATNGVTTDHDDLIPGRHAKGVHLGGGDDAAAVADQIMSEL